MEDGSGKGYAETGRQPVFEPYPVHFLVSLNRLAADAAAPHSRNENVDVFWLVLPDESCRMFVVHRIAVIEVEQPVPVKKITIEKHGLMRQAIVAAEFLECVITVYQLCPVLVYVIHVSVKEKRFSQISHRGADAVQHRSVVQIVVTAEEEDHRAAGRKHAFVEGVADPPVRFTHVMGDFFFVSPDNFRCSVGRSAVNDDVFEVSKRLTGHRLNGLFDVLLSVFYGRDD